jgi:hypothetical protein
MRPLIEQCHLTYGELLRLTKGHGTSTIYERVRAMAAQESKTFAKLKRAEAAHKAALATHRKETP